MQQIAAPLPLFHREPLYIGIDVGKRGHVAAFLNARLLEKHGDVSKCPVLAFENSREGFDQLLTRMENLADLTRCTVLVEKTGHYHWPLRDYLLEQGMTVYIMQTSVRNKHKTDIRDAQLLANRVYNQIGLGARLIEVSRIMQVSPPSSDVRRLSSLVSHREELSQDSIRRQNKLHALVDQLFPELVQIIKEPNGPTALNIRERFPTAQAVASSELEELLSCRTGTRPSSQALVRLRELALSSIGTRDAARLSGLIIEQGQQIREYRLLEEHLSELDTLIYEIISGSREGRILTSTGVISPLQAATILTSIVSIANFKSHSALKAFCGWSPRDIQSGTSLDSTPLSKGGNRALKKTFYLVAWNAIRPGTDSEWRALYERLVPRLCQFDAKKGVHRGKNKAVGRVAGQIISLVYHLLAADARALAEDPNAAPVLYSRERHHRDLARSGLHVM